MEKTQLDCLKVINFIEQSSFFSQNKLLNKKILIAYSGGQDSSSLLAIFYILREKWNLELGIVYCNHSWKGSSQNSSEIFKRLKQLNIPFYIVETPNLEPIKPEQKARNWRYHSFYEILKWGNYDFILTGHTLSDSVETTLFNLARSSGLKGICSLKEYQILQMSKMQKEVPFFNKRLQLKNISVPISTLTCANLLVFLPKKKYISFVNRYSQFFCKAKKQRLQQQPIYKFFENKEKTRKKEKLKSVITFVDPLFLNFEIQKLKTKKDCFNPGVFKEKKQSLNDVTMQNRFFSFNVEKLYKKKTNEKKKFCRLKPSLFFLQPKIIHRPPFVFKAINNKLFSLSFKRKRNYEIGNFLFYSSNPFLFDLNPNFVPPIIFKSKKKELEILRPLIRIDRETLALFSKKLSLPVYYDTSNKDLKLTRNYIRKIIIPLFKKINPQFEKNIYKFSKISEFYYEKVGQIDCPPKLFDVFHR